MKKTSYKDKKNEELLKALYEKRGELRSARFGQAGAKTRNANEMRVVKKDIARIMTELTSARKASNNDK